MTVHKPRWDGAPFPVTAGGVSWFFGGCLRGCVAGDTVGLKDFGFLGMGSPELGLP